MTIANTGPKLRSIGVDPIIHNGQQGLLLRDPLQLSDSAVVLPQQLAMLLALLDGTRSIPALRAAMARRTGVVMPVDLLEGLIAQLDETFLLDNERFTRALQRAVDDYRSVPFRPPASAGLSYPEEPGVLRALLDGYLDALDAAPEAAPDARGVFSPHIDYQRGGLSYARTWAAVADAAREAELVVILGTDHASSADRLTLTRQHYATPFGVLHTDQEVVERLSVVIGPDEAFADELHHRREHSLELSLVWLHHVRDGSPCPVAPILCGSFHRFVEGPDDPADDPTLNAVVDALREVVATRRTLIVASGDLAHMGPAFGGRPLGLVERAQIKVDDERLITEMCSGDAGRFFATLKAQEVRERSVCGTAPLYLMMRILEPSQGVRLAYDRCPADDQGTSVVSIAGVAFR